MATQVLATGSAPPFQVTLEGVQHIRRMRGGSQSQMMRGSDGCFHVVKFTSNPQHVRVLANEFFASKLGQRLGLPIPEVSTIEVCDWLIQHTPELHVESAGYRRPLNSGVHLASRFAADPLEELIFDWLPESFLQHVVNIGDFARTLVLDKWAGNCDGRQAVFIKSGCHDRQYRAKFIDQGYCFNAGQWDFPDLPLYGAYHQNCVYEAVRGWESFEPALTIAEQMDPSEIWGCAAGIPDEWCDGDVQALSRLVEELDRRRSKIRDLITGFRSSTRNPFPNWS